MPIRKQISYQFGGLQTVTLWTEKEVAAKLKMTIPALRKAIESGLGIPHHIHENRYKKKRGGSVQFTHREYFFNKGCWDAICQIAKERES